MAASFRTCGRHSGDRNPYLSLQIELGPPFDFPGAAGSLSPGARQRTRSTRTLRRRATEIQPRRMEREMSEKLQPAVIHGTPDPDKVSKTESHGCTKNRKRSSDGRPWAHEPWLIHVGR
jgi:hypothetical protein